MKKILIVMGRYLPGYKDGGPVQSIKNLTDRMGREYDFCILATDRDHGDQSAYQNIRAGEWNQVGNARVWYVKPGGFSAQAVSAAAENADLVYVCGCFNDYARTIMRLKRSGRLQMPVVIAPMGLFSPGAFQIHYPKKKAYVTICRLLGWFKNIEWSVTGPQEQQEVHSVIGKGAVCHVARDIPKVMSRRPKPIAKEKGELRIVFLSRISPKKNLEYALEALGGLKGRIIFDIYGIREDEEYYDICRKKMHTLPDNVKCTYKGEVRPDEVLNVFSGYHVFMFPTKAENYGHVIYEAMAGGCIPVISDRNPWQVLEEKEIGAVIPLEKKERYVSVLQEMVQWEQSEYERRQRKVVDYAWEYQQNIDCSGYRKIFELGG